MYDVDWRDCLKKEADDASDVLRELATYTHKHNLSHGDTAWVNTELGTRLKVKMNDV